MLLKVSAKNYSLLVILLLAPLLFSTIPQGQASEVAFFDDFNETNIGSTKWVVLENTNMSGYPAYGGSISIADDYMMLSSNGSSFPWVYTASNPFPATGDFSVEFSLTYTCIGDLGCGMMISNGPPTLDSSWHNRIVTLWAHDEGPDNGIIYIELFNSFAYKINVPGFKPSSPPHLYKVTHSQGNYTVYVDSEKVATAASQQRPTMIGFGNPPNPEVPQSPRTVADWGYWGWSSFKVDWFKVEAEVNNDAALRPSQISLFTTTETQQLGYKIGINGNLTSQGKPVSDARIILSYTLPGISTWQPIASVTTNLQGAYTVSWIPMATGDFTLRAEYAGNRNQTGSINTKNITVLESNSKNLFFVESNSTVTSLAFNSTSGEVSFTVSGPTGTFGYARFMISKQIVQDANSLKVYLDNSQVEYSLSSIDDMWILTFSYMHSKHTVLIRLTELSNAFSFGGLTLAFVISAIVMVTSVWASTALRKRKMSKIGFLPA